MDVLIVGAGPAGLTAAETLRGLDPAVRITLLSREPHPPYSPPAMADHFLTGRTKPLFWRGLDVGERLDVDYRAGVTATAIDPIARRVQLDDGTELAWDALLLAPGSRLHAPVEGWDRPGVHDFKSLTTAAALVDRVRRGEARSALIVGAGFIGMEIALLLADLGARVTIVGRRGWLMPRMLDQETAAIARGVMEARGVEVRLGVEATEFVGEPSVTGARLADGTVLRADACVAATGVKPNLDAVAMPGIDARWGLVVDDRLRTTAAGVWAAGDAVEAPDRFTGEPYVHAIFPNAVEQGRVAARNILGLDTRYEGAESMNSLKHLGLPVMAVGAAEGEDEVRWANGGGALRRIFLTDGRIAGFRFAGDVSGGGVLRSLMLRGEEVRRFGRRLARPGFGTADVVFSAMRIGG